MINVREYEREAARRLDRVVADYYNGGAEDEHTLQRNESAWQRWQLRQRVLVDVSSCQTSTTVLGTPLSIPIMVAPTAYHCMAHPDGECATARGAAGTLMVVSSLSTRSLEEIAAAAGGPLWFQLYTYRDRTVSERLIRRAETSGYGAIVLTVDVPVQGRRERDVRNGFGLPANLRMANFSEDAFASLPPRQDGTSSLAHYIGSLFDPSLDWRMLAWLRKSTSLPIVVKGIMTGEDARLAGESGADAVVVSNHGGRQLDAGQGTAEVIEEVVAAAGTCEVYADGGIRRGTDVLKALALGARAVLVGRPVLWGLAVAGDAGVRHVLDLLGEELKSSMQLCGLRSVADVNRTILRSADPR